MNRTKWNKILRVRTHHTTVYETPLSTDGMTFSDIGTGPDSPLPNAPKQLTWKDSELEPNYQQDSVTIPEQNLKRKREEEPFNRNVRKRYDLKRPLQITYLPRKRIKM